jgi:hypothetical protein
LLLLLLLLLQTCVRFAAYGVAVTFGALLLRIRNVLLPSHHPEGNCRDFLFLHTI